MKKFMKTLFFLLVIFTVGVGGYYVGASSSIAVGDKVAIPKEEYETVRRVGELKSFINEYFLFDVDEEKLKDGVYHGLFEGLDDPYSVYYNEKQFADMLEQTSGKYSGIGVIVSPSEGNYITVVSPIAGTPGDRAGLKPGDMILAVDGKTYLSKDLDEAVSKMKGQAGESVTLKVQRNTKDGGSETFDVEIVREVISLETVKHAMLEDGLGYISIIQFDEQTEKSFLSAMEELKGQGARGIVLDLRNNPGGRLDVTLKIADELLGEATIISTVDNKGKESVEKSDAKQDTIPMVVLINEGSASASEILAVALKDNERAKVVGVKSFGKGTVQRIFPLGSEGPGFKLTVGEYYAPKGEKIHEIGVEPDVVVELNAEVDEIGPSNLEHDNQLQEAIRILQEEVNPEDER